MQKTRKHSKRPLLHLTGILLLLVLFTTYLIPNGLYARYVTNAEGEDGAKVASFDVRIESSSTIMNFNGSNHAGPKETLEYLFSIDSRSEVALGYTVTVSFGATPPPENIRLWIDDESTAQPGEAGKTEFVFSGFEYQPNEGKKSHRLSIEVAYLSEDGAYTFEPFSGTVTISVVAEQKAHLK